MNEQRKIGQILVERGIINKEQLDEALKEHETAGLFIGEILVKRGAASEEQVAQTLSQQLGLALVDLSRIIIEPKARDSVPEESCLKFTAIPLYITQNTLTLAIANPLDTRAIEEIQAVSNYQVKPVFAYPTAIRRSIAEQYRRESREEPTAGQPLPSFEYEEPKTVRGADQEVPVEQLDSLKQAASLAPVVEMVNNIITRAVEAGASDIHFEPERGSFNCRYRIDGVLYPATRISLQDQAAVLSRIKIMANMDIAEKRLAQDGRAQMNTCGRDVDLRVSTFPTIYGENLVIRILDRSTGILRLKQLGFSKESLAVFSQLIHRPYGIILVTGPTGSGKTTTLYAALSEINSLEKNIITLEDPVEYEIPHIRQSQVNVKAGLTFASGLRSMVRQDPDIIMIGEIRDKETADIAIHAALTGHLVFTTLHTNDAPSAATRLIDMGIEPFLVASSIIGILAQRLVRTLCKSCKKSYTPSTELLGQLGLTQAGRQETGDGRRITSLRRRLPSKKFSFGEGGKAVFYKETGCPKCNQRGYLGRIGIFELLIPDEEIKEMITRKTSAAALRDSAVKTGMTTLRDEGLQKVASGITSVSELLRVTEKT